MTSVSFLVAQQLAACASEVFGVMGNGNAYFIDALSRAGMRFTALRHEAGGVAAADGYFRASGHLAIATTTYGPGFTNALTPLAEAVRASTPMVLVVGSAPLVGARTWDVDQTALATAVGAPTVQVTVGTPMRDTARAVELALTRRAPVVLAIPYDIASVETRPEPPVRAVQLPSPPVPDVDGAARILADARRVLILAGRGAWLDHAEEPLAELAERLGAVTATTALAAGLFGHSSTDLGIAGGFGTDDAAAVMHAADVVLVAGASLTQFTTRFDTLFAPDAHILQIDLAERSTHPQVDVLLTGSVRATTRALLSRIPAGSRPCWISDIPGGRFAEFNGDSLAPDGRLDPRALATALDAALPANRTVVQDGGHFIGWAPGYWHIPSPDRLIMVGTAFQSIGLGFPSAVGAAIALPDTTTVLCTGDGGGLMALSDFETFIRTARSGVVVVFNDAAYGAELHQYEHLDHAAMLIPETNFCLLGRALGAVGTVVECLDDLSVLSSWDRRGVLVLDCRISRSIVAPFLEEWMHAAR